MAKRIYNATKRREWYQARTAADIPATGRAERDVPVPYNETARVCACGAKLSGYNAGNACWKCCGPREAQFQERKGNDFYPGARTGGAELVWLDFVDYL